MSNKFISKLQGYAALSHEDVRALEQVTYDARSFAPKEDLIREGDQPGPVFVMLEGWAFRYKILPSGARQIMAFMMPGDACDLHVGMLAAMDHGIQTVKRSRVAVIANEVMSGLLDDHPRIARAMYIAQLVDESTLRAWIVSLGRRNSAERAAHLLLELYARGVKVGLVVGDALDLPLTQEMLADALGMTPVHVNRVLQELRRSGAVELKRGVLRLLDTEALTKFSGFDDNFLHRRLRNLTATREH